jgi:hypothetical protein
LSEPPELRDLLDADLSDAQVEALRQADLLLRRVPAPPAELPPALSARVAAIATRPAARSRRRAAAVLALAASLGVLFAVLAFGLGYRLGGENFETVRTVEMQATAAAPGATASIRLGAADRESGNWELLLDVGGLPPLPSDGYYVLWLAKDGEYAGTCGTFAVGDGHTTVRMTASYPLDAYDEWVISARATNPDDRPPWLLRAPTT